MENFNPLRLPDLVLWLETDEYGDVTNVTNQNGGSVEVFCWADPNNSERGIQLVFSKPQTDEIRARINAWLVERFNPSFDELPKS